MRISSLYLFSTLIFLSLGKVFGQDFPRNSLKKNGWKLIFSDDFTKKELDLNSWIPYYFRHRNYEDKLSSYELKDGNLILRINSSNQKVSSIQTIDRSNLHKKGVRDIPTKILLSVKYGYFEIRAKTQKGSGNHCAFWLIGAQDNENQNAEIDIFEQVGILGDSTLLFNMHPWSDNMLINKISQNKSIQLKNKLKLDKDLTTSFNIYGLEWTEDEIIFYFNNKPIKKISASVTYNMGVVLSLYEGSEWTGEVNKSVKYPKQFIIDYFRVYKKRREKN